ncbi:MAG: DUF370 domain-containing protein [Eubacteriales bacterium]
MSRNTHKKTHPFINIGGTSILCKEDVLGVFDLDTASTKTDTKRYLSAMEQAKRLENVANDIPKSFVVLSRGIREKVYMTSLSTATLYGRWKRQSKYL